jgi:hypothetical protein
MVFLSWSECGIDNFDDDGEGHDGDSSWYQTRTQSFCANSAYSLYGVLKHDAGVNAVYGSPYDVIVNDIDRLYPHCTRLSYINSFFTYNGADTLLSSLGFDQVSTLSNLNNNNNNNNYNGYNVNAQCIAVSQNDNNNNKNKQGSNDNKNNNNHNGESATMGCANDGSFGIALFEGTTCDGKYFINMTDDTLDKYNSAMHRIRCYKIYDSPIYDDVSTKKGNGNNRKLEEWSLSSYTSEASMLLQHSWACDIDLYPDECPDPYGIKKKYALITKSVQQGGSRTVPFSILSVQLRTPFWILSWIMLATGIVFLIHGFHISKKSTIDSHGGGWSGFFVMVWNDIKLFFVNVKDWCISTQEKCKTVLKKIRANRRKRLRRSGRGGKDDKRRKSHKGKSRSRRHDPNDDDFDGEDGDDDRMISG